MLSVYLRVLLAFLLIIVLTWHLLPSGFVLFYSVANKRSPEASALDDEQPEESDHFRFLHSVFLDNLQGTVGLILAKTSVMRISIPLDLSSRSFIPLPCFIRFRRPMRLLTPSLVLCPPRAAFKDPLKTLDSLKTHKITQGVVVIDHWDWYLKIYWGGPVGSGTPRLEQKIRRPRSISEKGSHQIRSPSFHHRNNHGRVFLICTKTEGLELGRLYHERITG